MGSLGVFVPYCLSVGTSVPISLAMGFCASLVGLEGALHMGKLRHGGAEGLARRDLSTQGIPSGAPQPGCAHIPTSHMHGGTGTCNSEL